MKDGMPTHAAILLARDWLFAGCPAASRNHDAKGAARILLDLVEALPQHFPEYAWGSPEWKAALENEES